MAALTRVEFQKPFLFDSWVFWLPSCLLRGVVWDCFLAKAYLPSRDKLHLEKKPTRNRKKVPRDLPTPLVSLLHVQNGKRVPRYICPRGVGCVNTGFWLGVCWQGHGSGARAWEFFNEVGKVVWGGKDCRWGRVKAQCRASAAMLSVMGSKRLEGVAERAPWRPPSLGNAEGPLRWQLAFQLGPSCRACRSLWIWTTRFARLGCCDWTQRWLQKVLVAEGQGEAAGCSQWDTPLLPCAGRKLPFGAEECVYCEELWGLGAMHLRGGTGRWLIPRSYH